MSEDLIRREDLMKFPIRLNHYDKKNGNIHFVLGIESVLEYASMIPSVDIDTPISKGYERVVHAYWKPLRVYPDEYVCSYCGELWNDVKTTRCHECGAIMDLDRKDENYHEREYAYGDLL